MSLHKNRKGDDEDKNFLMNLNHSHNDSTQMLNRDVSPNLLFKRNKKINSLSDYQKETSDIKSENRKIVEDAEGDINSSRRSKADVSKEDSRTESKVKERGTTSDNKSETKQHNNYIQDLSSVKSNPHANKEKHTVTSGKKGNNDCSSQRELHSHSESNTSSDDNNKEQRDFEPSFSEDSVDQEERHYRQLLKTERIVSIYIYMHVRILLNRAAAIQKEKTPRTKLMFLC